MTVRKRAIKAFKSLSFPVSYKVLDDSKMPDSRNVFDNKSITDTRYGIKRFNTTTLGGAILSVSYFKTSAGVRYKLAKVGTVLYSVNATGAATAIKSGLSATTKHRAITLNDRHIVGIESDGLFSFNGTIFTELGQAPPTGASAAVTSGGSLTDANNFKAGLTFYSSVTGFESNVFESEQVTTANPNKQITISSIPATASNGTIDKIRVYLKNTTSNTAYLYVNEIDLGTTSYIILATPTSAIVPPTKNAVPEAGGGKFLTSFGKKVAYAGNATYLSEVWLSEEYLPDAFDRTTTQINLQIPGQGPITGIATGLFSDTFLTPFLVVFKKTSISIYSELNGIPNLTTLDAHIGCISNETIRIRNGAVFFMSENGWHGIVNGVLIKGQNGESVSLGNGAIDDIFSRVGWTYELNIPQASSFFSAYYPTDGLYLTFVCEGANTSITKAYVYEEKIGGFRPWDFKTAFTCACEGEDDSGYQVIFLGDSTGTLFTYSSRNSRSDEDKDGVEQSIPAFAMLPYIQPGDDASTYNFRTLAVRALSSDNPITVRTFPAFSLQAFSSFTYDFPNTAMGFTLDVSQLDIDVLGDERIPVTAMADLNQTGETLLVGFYQDIIGASMGLISAQITSNKNGNLNQ